jgi:hypothetical protein
LWFGLGWRRRNEVTESGQTEGQTRQNELELAQRAANEAERQSRFERRLKLVELRERRKDRELKRLEIENSAGRGVRFTSAQATVAAAALAVLSAIAGGLIQSSSSKVVEASRIDAQLEIERLRAQHTIDLENQKQQAAERLERAEFETTLILKAIEAPAREDQIRNLKFFLNAGFISDTDGKIAAIEESDLPSLPRQIADPEGPLERSWLNLMANRVPCEPRDDVSFDSAELPDGSYTRALLEVAAEEARRGITEFCAPERILDYWSESTPWFEPSASTGWAAAFVGWVIAQTGNRMQLKGLGPGVRHIWWSAQRRGLVDDDFSNLRVGDIVVWVRNADLGMEIETLRERVFSGEQAAWDGNIGFVSSLSQNSMIIIGGNQANAVSARTLPRDPVEQRGPLVPLGYIRLE